MVTPQHVRDDALASRTKALAFRDAQQMAAAHEAIENAARLSPADPGIAFIRAQIALETGRPSAALFAAAHMLDPENLMLARNHAAALADAGNVDAAIDMLDRRLSQNPDWLDGHKLRTNLATAAGHGTDAASCYAAACAAQPQNLALRLAWFHLMSLARQWDQAKAIIDEGERLIGERTAFTLARLYIASESGAAANDTELFAGVTHLRDAGLDICQTRHWLRLGDPGQAEMIAARNIGGASAAAFWPYLSLAWRMGGNSKSEWLDNPANLIRSFDLPFGDDQLQNLAGALRKLHSRKAHFPEQSVRGGTQTDGQLFLHHDPAIQDARAIVTDAVAAYIRDLPPHDPEHPMLGLPRAGQRGANIKFEGSWSVSLAAQGYHSCHTHVRGWISSALYIALPDADAMGVPPAGWLEFGTPPPELGLNLTPYTRIEPKPGRLVLFPSHMWHGTVPFCDGERLSIAFDVRRPGP
jgi:tetratricopeptide (TPR) repeat protein